MHVWLEYHRRGPCPRVRGVGGRRAGLAHRQQEATSSLKAPALGLCGFLPRPWKMPMVLSMGASSSNSSWLARRVPVLGALSGLFALESLLSSLVLFCILTLGLPELQFPPLL